MQQNEVGENGDGIGVTEKGERSDYPRNTELLHRICAYSIDALIVFFVEVLIFIIIKPKHIPWDVYIIIRYTSYEMIYTEFIIRLLFPFYSIFMLLRFKSTIGMKIFNLLIASCKNEEIFVSQLFLRVFLFTGPFVLSSIVGLISVYLKKDLQRGFDLIGSVYTLIVLLSIIVVKNDTRGIHGRISNTAICKNNV